MKNLALSSILTLALTLAPARSASAQPAQTPAGSAEQKGDKAAAYYNFAMGHLNAELAAAFNNRGEYFNKAIEHYRAAIKADPSASFLTEELAELYIQAGKIRDAVIEAEEGLRANPSDVNLRRVLGRIYLRSIGNPQTNSINEEMLKKATEQFLKITELAPTDSASWLMLGRLYKVAQNSPESERAYKKGLEIDPGNEEGLTGLAMVYADLGDTKGAADLLKKATEKSPSVRTLAALAAAYEQLRDFSNAAATLRKALEMQPGNVEVKRGLAQNLLLSEKLDEAMTLFQEITTEEPKDSTAWLRISQIYRQQRKFDKAREAGQKAAEADPSSIEAQYNDVSLLEAEGRSSDAIEALKKILSTTAKKNYHPGEKANRVILLERLGFLQRNAEQFSPAIETFRQMQQLDEESSSRAAVHIIETYRASREIPKAFEEAKSAREKFPKDRAVQSMYAFIAADAGKSAEAESVARELFKEKDRESYITLSQIYERTKNYAEMSKSLDEAEKLSEDKEEKEGVYFMRGAMYEKMKKFDQAEAEFRKVITSNSKSAGALNYLGYMLADRNVRLSEAHDLIQKALSLDPNNGAYLDSMGWVLFRLNRLTEAEENLTKAIERTGKDPTVHDHLGDVFAKQGKLKEAAQQWQRSLKEWENTPSSEQDSGEVAKIQKKLEGAKVKLARENKK